MNIGTEEQNCPLFSAQQIAKINEFAAINANRKLHATKLELEEIKAELNQLKIEQAKVNFLCPV